MVVAEEAFAVGEGTPEGSDGSGQRPLVLAEGGGAVEDPDGVDGVAVWRMLAGEGICVGEEFAVAGPVRGQLGTVREGCREQVRRPYAVPIDVLDPTVGVVLVGGAGKDLDEAVDAQGAVPVVGDHVVGEESADRLGERWQACLLGEGVEEVAGYAVGGVPGEDPQDPSGEGRVGEVVQSQARWKNSMGAERSAVAYPSVFP
ncbi:hypothetical protein ACGFZP_31245 [Kitasatospora sp. NPDC048239]|uniref:hypothetical protein n=1 Tax=Kitasatospora sp. NPDC048239 TaxID=3364046 RepID=UPI003714D3A3